MGPVFRVALGVPVSDAPPHRVAGGRPRALTSVPRVAGPLFFVRERRVVMKLGRAKAGNILLLNFPDVMLLRRSVTLPRRSVTCWVVGQGGAIATLAYYPAMRRVSDETAVIKQG